MSEGLLRQRRNLLLSSFLMFLISALHLKIEKINFLGTQISIERPEYLAVTLIIVQCYFFLRYIQYYLEENNIPNPIEVFRRNYESMEELYLKKMAIRKLGEFELTHFKYLYQNSRIKSFDSLTDQEGFLSNEKVGLFSRKIYTVIQVYGDDKNKGLFNHLNTEFDGSIENAEGWEIVKNPEKGNQRSEPFIRNFVIVNVFVLMWFKVASLLKYLFTQSFFTDYQLPIVVGILALVGVCI